MTENMTARVLVTVKPLAWELDGDMGWRGISDTAGCVLTADTLQGAEVLERRRAARILAALDLSAVDALVAENKRLRDRLARGLDACNRFDGPVSRSQFVNGQATCAQQIRAVMEDTP